MVEEKVFVIVTNMNGSKLDEIVFMVVSADSKESARLMTLDELYKNGPVDMSEAEELFEKSFFIQEMPIVIQKGALQ